MADRPRRLPRFDDAYRNRWIDAGLWTDRTLHDLFDETVAEHPEAVAVITREQRLGFAELKRSSDALAAGLVGLGVERGDIVAVQLPNWIEFCLLQLALSRVGAVLVDRYRPRDVLELIEREHVTSISGTPAHLIGILHHPEFSDFAGAARLCAWARQPTLPLRIASAPRVRPTVSRAPTARHHLHHAAGRSRVCASSTSAGTGPARWRRNCWPTWVRR